MDRSVCAPAESAIGRSARTRSSWATRPAASRQRTTSGDGSIGSGWRYVALVGLAKAKDSDPRRPASAATAAAPDAGGPLAGPGARDAGSLVTGVALASATTTAASVRPTSAARVGSESRRSTSTRSAGSSRSSWTTTVREAPGERLDVALEGRRERVVAGGDRLAVVAGEEDVRGHRPEAPAEVEAEREVEHGSRRDARVEVDERGRRRQRAGGEPDRLAVAGGRERPHEDPGRHESRERERESRARELARSTGARRALGRFREGEGAVAGEHRRDEIDVEPERAQHADRVEARHDLGEQARRRLDAPDERHVDRVHGAPEDEETSGEERPARVAAPARAAQAVEDPDAGERARHPAHPGRPAGQVVGRAPHEDQVAPLEHAPGAPHAEIRAQDERGD